MTGVSGPIAAACFGALRSGWRHGWSVGPVALDEWG